MESEGEDYETHQQNGDHQDQYNLVNEVMADYYGGENLPEDSYPSRLDADMNIYYQNSLNFVYNRLNAYVRSANPTPAESYWTFMYMTNHDFRMLWPDVAQRTPWMRFRTRLLRAIPDNWAPIVPSISSNQYIQDQLNQLPIGLRLEVLSYLSRELVLLGYGPAQVRSMLSNDVPVQEAQLMEARFGAYEWVYGNLTAISSCLISLFRINATTVPLLGQAIEVEETVLGVVENQITNLASLGLRPSRRDGAQLARSVFFKVLMLNVISTLVRPVNATSQAECLAYAHMTTQYVYKKIYNMNFLSLIVGFFLKIFSVLSEGLVYVSYISKQACNLLPQDFGVEICGYSPNLFWCYFLIINAMYFYLVWNVFNIVRNTLRCKYVDYKPNIKFSVENPLDSVSVPRFENAMSGSGAFPCSKATGALAILAKHVNNGTVEFSHMGMAFRYDEYIVTAFHVIDKIVMTGGEVYISPYIEKERKAVLSSNTASLVSLSPRRILDEDYESAADLTIFQIDTKFFSENGVKSVKGKSVAYNSVVNTVGPLGSVRLHAASGHTKRIEDEEFAKVYYTATTHSGWSGGPVYSGNRIVAMHQRGGVEFNEGLNFVFIKYLIDRYGKGTQEEDSTDVFWDPVHRVLRDTRGYEVQYRRWGGDPDEIEYTNAWGQKEYTFLSDVRHLEEDEVEYMVSHGKKSNKRKFTRENANYGDHPVVSPDTSRAITIMSDVVRTNLLRHGFEKLKGNRLGLQGLPLVLSEQKRNLSGVPTHKPPDDRVMEALDLETAQRLGYDPEKYQFPDLGSTEKEKRKAVSESFFKHVSLFRNAYERDTVPDSRTKMLTYMVLRKLLRFNRFYAESEPLSDENLESIINSSRITGSNNPGHPFIEAGLTTNAAVIEKYGLEGLCDLVRQNERSNIHVFPKNEPTKAAKLDKGMVRIISGVGLLDQIKAHAYFSNFNIVASDNYRKSPIMCGWSPQKPTDAEWFVKKFLGFRRKENRVYTDDCKNWDYSLKEWMIQMVVEAVVDLAIPRPYMDKAEFENWKDEARKVAYDQFTLSFQLPDGTVVNRKSPCLMTSGSVLTFMFNSVAMLVLDTVAKVEMGYNIDDIVEKFLIKVGGDDKIQSAPACFDHEKYSTIFGSYGVTLHDCQSFDTIEGAEFFSVRFGVENKEVVWTPTRFSKHVESVKFTKYTDLPQALVSHMTNWVHSEDHYLWFRKIFIKLNQDDPENFPLSMLVSRDELLFRLKGFECRL